MESGDCSALSCHSHASRTVVFLPGELCCHCWISFLFREYSRPCSRLHWSAPCWLLMTENSSSSAGGPRRSIRHRSSYCESLRPISTTYWVDVALTAFNCRLPSLSLWLVVRRGRFLKCSGSTVAHRVNDHSVNFFLKTQRDTGFISGCRSDASESACDVGPRHAVLLSQLLQHNHSHKARPVGRTLVPSP